MEDIAGPGEGLSPRDLEAVWGPNGTASRGAPADAPTPEDRVWEPALEELRGDAPGARPLGPAVFGQTAAILPAAHRRSARRLVVAGAAVSVFVVAATTAVVVQGRNASNVAVGAPTTSAAPGPNSERDPAAVAVVSTTSTPPSTVPVSTTTTAAVTTTAPVAASTAAWLAGAEQAARGFVGAMERRDCEALWSMWSARTLSFLNSMSEGESAKDELCDDLRSEDIPQIAVRPPARPGPAGGAVVDLEAEGQVEPLYLVFEQSAWKVDLLGSMNEGE